MTRLLTVPEVAEICGVAPETVRRLTDRGAMPQPVRLGRAVRYREDGTDEPKRSNRGWKPVALIYQSGGENENASSFGCHRHHR